MSHDPSPPVDVLGDLHSRRARGSPHPPHPRHNPSLGHQLVPQMGHPPRHHRRSAPRTPSNRDEVTKVRIDGDSRIPTSFFSAIDPDHLPPSSKMILVSLKAMSDLGHWECPTHTYSADNSDIYAALIHSVRSGSSTPKSFTAVTILVLLHISANTSRQRPPRIRFRCIWGAAWIIGRIAA